ncbi:MAG TPA: TonB-dependent receptor [Thermoanaerobaculia bacterium]|nr:TonB-dependent receptor [Thermoanaerobaculia bacterium]
MESPGWRALVALIVLAVTSPAVGGAQTAAGETGAIEGRVTDESGAPLSGIRVAMRHAEGDPDRELATRRDGSYGVVGLPAGSYSVEVWAEGFSSAIAEGVGLDSGETLRLDFTLAAGSGIAITVISSPRIDVASPSRILRVPGGRLDQLPGRLRFPELARLSDAFTWLPVPREGLEPVREGVAKLELRGRPLEPGSVLIDGVEADVQAAPPLELDTADAFQRDLEVTAGGLHPFFEGAPGGTVRLTAPSTEAVRGGDWRVGLELGFGLDGLDEPSVEGSSLGGFRVERNLEEAGDLSASVGGSPFGRDLGLFAAGVGRRSEIVQRLTGDRRAEQEVDESAALLRVTGTPAARLRIGASLAGAEIEADGLLTDTAELSQAAVETHGAGSRKNRHAAFSLDLGVGTRLHLHGWAGWLDRSRQDPADEGRRLVYLTSGRGLGLPALYDGGAGFASGKPGLAQNGEREGASLRVQASRLAGGGHRLAFGVEGSRADVSLRRELLGALTEVRWGGAPSQLGTRFDLSAALQGEIERDSEALFVEDQWRLTRRWTLQLGLRAESHRVSAASAGPGPTPERHLDRELDEGVEPRLGLAWDVLGDGNYVIYLSADRFHRELDDRLAIAALGRVDLDRSIGAFGSLEELLSVSGGETVIAGVSSPVVVDPQLSAERWRRFALGSEQLVIPGLRVRAEASYRELERGVALVFVDLGDGGLTPALANPGEGLARRPYGGSAPEHPGMASRRFGLEMGADVRLGGRFTAGGSYTYSQADGNVDGSASPFDLSASLAAFGPATAAADLLPAPVCAILEGCFGTDGSAATDRPLDDRRHRWKIYGSWALPRGLDLSAYFQYLSGAPETARISALSSSDGALTAVGAVAVSGLEESRVGDSVSQLDLEASWRIEAGPFAQEGRRLSFFVLVSNVLDQSRALSRWDRLTLEPIVVPREAFFEGFDALALAEAQGVALDPRFGGPRLVQRAREARLGLRLEF